MAIKHLPEHVRTVRQATDVVKREGFKPADIYSADPHFRNKEGIRANLQEFAPGKWAILYSEN